MLSLLRSFSREEVEREEKEKKGKEKCIKEKRTKRGKMCFIPRVTEKTFILNIKIN